MQHWHLCRKALTLVAVLGIALAMLGCSDDDGGGGGVAPDLRSFSGTRILLTNTALPVLEGQTFDFPGTALNEASNLDNVTIVFADTFNDRDNSGDISIGDRLRFTVFSDTVNPPIEEQGFLEVTTGTATAAGFQLRFRGGTFPNNTLPAIPAPPAPQDPTLNCAGAACRLQLTASNVPIGGVEVPGTVVLVLTNQAGTAVVPPATSATNVGVSINNNGRVFIDGVFTGLDVE
jgi:hypothetical protein